MSGFLPQVAFRWFKPDGTPAFGYTAAFFGAGLTPIQANLKEVYDQTDLVAPISQTTVLPQLGVPFDVEGKMTIVLGNGNYLVAIYNELNILSFSIDNITSGTIGTLFANNIAELRAFSVADSQVTGFCYLLGYYNPGDDGHGVFYWDDADFAPDDDGYTISPDAAPVTGRWKRINDENGDVRAAAFGYDANTGTNQTAQMVAADGYAFVNNRRLRIGLGTSAMLGTMTFLSNVIFEGSGITGTGAPTITFNGQVEGPTVKLFYSMTVNMMGLCRDVKPEWWGALRDGLNDDIIPIKAMFASGAGSCFFTAGTYLVVGDPLTPAPLVLVIRADGQVQDGPTTYVHFGLTSLTANSQVKADLIEALSTMIAGTTIVAGTGITSTTGSIQATAGQVNAGTSMAAQTTIDTISGGITSGLFLKARAGTGAQRFKAGGNLAAIIGAGNFSLPANTLVDDGDILRIAFDGVFTPAGVNNYTFATLFGGVAMTTAAIIVFAEANPSPFRLEIIVKKTGVNTITSHAILISRAVAVTSIIGENTVTNPTLTGACTIQSGFAGTGGTILQTALFVDFFPSAI
jgi:hypothetical protein